MASLIMFPKNDVFVTKFGGYGERSYFKFLGSQLYDVGMKTSAPWSNGFEKKLIKDVGGFVFEIPQGKWTRPIKSIQVDEYTCPGQPAAEASDWQSGIRYEVYHGGYDRWDPCEPATHRDWYLQVRVANGKFDPLTLMGDFLIAGPYGTRAEISGNLKEACDLAVAFGDEMQAKVQHLQHCRYPVLKTAVQNALVVFPKFHYGGMKYHTRPYRYGNSVTVEGQVFPAHEMANARNGRWTKTWAECAKEWDESFYSIETHNPGHNFFFSDGDRVWVEVPNGELSTEKFEFTTRHFQNWKAVALLGGLGFKLNRSADCDVFESATPVEMVFEAWVPSKDGSTFTSWDKLSDPESPQYGRKYLTVFHFRTPESHEDVIAFASSPHSSDQLYCPVALSSLEDWQRLKKFEGVAFDGELRHWLQTNAVSF